MTHHRWLLWLKIVIRRLRIKLELKITIERSSGDGFRPLAGGTSPEGTRA